MRPKIHPLFWKTVVALGLPVLAAAILFPVFGRARENARKSSCQSNLKQMMLGIAQYAQDYGNRLPLVQNASFKVTGKGTAQTTWGVYGWADALQPYLKSTCLFQCPSDVFPPGGSGGISASNAGYTDYYFNARLRGALANNSRSAHIVAVGDGIGDKRSTARYVLGSPPDENVVCTGYEGACQSAWKHLGGANFAFLDGHVKWLQPDEVSATKGDRFTFAP